MGTGKVSTVNSDLKLDTMPGHVGIGHTRWATHGRVNKINAHPHLC
jgi:glucosamine--fructose-6-phosphate aminotransferase (isomerizing)